MPLILLGLLTVVLCCHPCAAHDPFTAPAAHFQKPQCGRTLQLIVQLLDLNRREYFGYIDSFGGYINDSHQLRQRLAPFLNRCHNRPPKEGRGIGMCTIMREEEPYLQEWLVYHILLGFKHFFLYDNSDYEKGEGIHLAARLNPFVEAGYVTVIPWTSRIGNHEKRAYSICAESSADEGFAWVGMFSVDEFVFIDDAEECIEKAVEPYRDYGGLTLSWRRFGASGHLQSQAHRLVTESYTMYAPDAPQLKSLVRPDRVSQFDHVHYPIYKPPYYPVDTSFRPMTGKPTSTYHNRTAVIRLNHYRTKSLEENLRKMAKGRATSSRKEHIFEFVTRGDTETLRDEAMFERIVNTRKALL